MTAKLHLVKKRGLRLWWAKLWRRSQYDFKRGASERRVCGGRS